MQPAAGSQHKDWRQGETTKVVLSEGNKPNNQHLRSPLINMLCLFHLFVQKLKFKKFKILTNCHFMGGYVTDYFLAGSSYFLELPGNRDTIMGALLW